MLAKVRFAPGSVKPLTCFLSNVSGIFLWQKHMAKSVGAGAGKGQSECRGGVTARSSLCPVSSGHLSTNKLFESDLKSLILLYCEGDHMATPPTSHCHPTPRFIGQSSGIRGAWSRSLTGCNSCHKCQTFSREGSQPCIYWSITDTLWGRSCYPRFHRWQNRGSEKFSDSVQLPSGSCCVIINLLPFHLALIPLPGRWPTQAGPRQQGTDWPGDSSWCGPTRHEG